MRGFNRNQKRDRNGKWTRGGGPLTGKKASKRISSAKLQANRDRNAKLAHGAVVGFALGAGTKTGGLKGALIGAGLNLVATNYANKQAKKRR